MSDSRNDIKVDCEQLDLDLARYLRERKDDYLDIRSRNRLYYRFADINRITVTECMRRWRKMRSSYIKLRELHTTEELQKIYKLASELSFLDEEKKTAKKMKKVTVDKSQAKKDKINIPSKPCSSTLCDVTPHVDDYIVTDSKLLDILEKRNKLDLLTLLKSQARVDVIPSRIDKKKFSSEAKSGLIHIKVPNFLYKPSESEDLLNEFVPDLNLPAESNPDVETVQVKNETDDLVDCTETTFTDPIEIVECKVEIQSDEETILGK